MRGKVAIGIKAGNRSLTIKYAEPGAVLGLPEAISGSVHRDNGSSGNGC